MNRDAGFPRRADKGGALFPPDKEPMSATIDLPEPVTRFRPVVPPPLREPLGLFAFLKAARTNPITTWMDAHFKLPVVAAEGAMGRITVVSDPALIRYLLIEKADNYRKDDL